MSVARFDNGQRVFVRVNHLGETVELWGTVCRLRRADEGAWIDLDERHACCPFPEDDPRGKQVMAYPEGCSSVEMRAVRELPPEDAP